MPAWRAPTRSGRPTGGRLPAPSDGLVSTLIEETAKEERTALGLRENAAQFSPKLFQAYNGMAYAWRKLGNYEKALELYDRAIEMAPRTMMVRKMMESPHAQFLATPSRAESARRATQRWCLRHEGGPRTSLRQWS